MAKEIIEMQSESIFTWNAQGLPHRLGIHKTKAKKPSVEREYAVLIEKYRPLAVAYQETNVACANKAKRKTTRQYIEALEQYHNTL